VRRFAPPLALLVAAVGVWELVVRVRDVPDYLFPAPTAVAKAFDSDGRVLASATWVTVREVVLGYALAVAVALALAIVLHFSALLRRALLPILVLSQTVPTVLLAPILAILFGFGLTPKLIVVAVVCFFPIVVNAVDGLRSTDAELVRMMRTLDANRSAIFRRVELPGALPAIFTGARVLRRMVRLVGRTRLRRAPVGAVTRHGAHLRRRPHPLGACARPLRAGVARRASSHSLAPGGRTWFVSSSPPRSRRPRCSSHRRLPACST
jgi:ABC-type nitrate/sulfonate/bicarbonate transport system permease component